MSKWLSEWMDILDFQLICVVMTRSHLMTAILFRHLIFFSCLDFSNFYIFQLGYFFFLYLSINSSIGLSFLSLFHYYYYYYDSPSGFFFLGGLVCLFRPIFFVSFIVIIMIIMMTIFIGIISHCGPVSHSLFSFLPLSLSLSFSFIPLSLSFSLPLSLFLFRNYFLFVEWGAGLYFPDSPWHRHWSVFQILITAIIFFDLHFLLSIDFMDLFRSLSLSLFFLYLFCLISISLSLSLSLSLFAGDVALFPQILQNLRKNRTERRGRLGSDALSKQKQLNNKNSLIMKVIEWQQQRQFAPFLLFPPLSPRSFPSTPSGIIN